MEKKEYMQLSRTAFNEFQAKLEHLKNTRRLEVAQHIKEARAFGDISENAEYDAAMDEQSALEAEIAQLEDLLSHVEVLDESAIDLSSVSVGTRITVHLVEHDFTETYDIVSTTESEPFRKRFKVRCDGSERNRALGYKEGDEITHECPRRKDFHQQKFQAPPAQQAGQRHHPCVSPEWQLGHHPGPLGQLLQGQGHHRRQELHRLCRPGLCEKELTTRGGSGKQPKQKGRGNSFSRPFF